MPKVNLKEVGRAVGAPQPSGSFITDKYIEYQGQRVSEVPAGERFDIYASAVSRNPGSLLWEILITAVSDDGEIATYDTTDANGDPYTSPVMKLDSLPPGNFELPRMPDHDISLYFKSWGNDTRGQDIPPVEDWVTPV